MGSDLLGIGLSGLAAAQAGLRTAGHNIANVNTTGYSRQEVLFAARPPQFTGGGWLGQGVNVTNVRRLYSDFLGAQTTRATADASQLDAFATQLDRLDNLFGNATSGLAPALDDFFSSLNAVAANPSDTPSRQTLLSSSQALVDRFHQLDGQLDELKAQSNDQIRSTVASINGISAQIAELNKRIATLTVDPSNPPNDLLDQRDQLVVDLNKQVGASVVVQSDGSYNVFLSNGQAVVVGDQATALAVQTSADDPSSVDVGIDTSGGLVAFSSTDVTGGALGAALAFRDGALDSAQDALGRIAVALGSAVNAQHHLGIDLNGNAGGDFFSVPAPIVTTSQNNTGTGVLSVSVADATTIEASDYRLDYDGTNYTLTRLSDGNAQTFASFPQTVDGLTFTLAGAPATGDHFLIQATHYAAGTLALAVTDASAIAAAAPIRTSAGVSNVGSGKISAGSVDASYLATPLATPVTLAYASGTNTLSGFPAVPVSVTVNGTTTVYPAATPVPYTAGASISFGGITFTLAGALANGDTFTIAPNASGIGDARNAQALAALATQNLVAGGTSTFTGAYGQLVAANGNASREAAIERDAQNALLTQVQQAQAQVSGVNLDEEAADLQRFQQAYQAAAKVMTVAASLFQSVLDIAKGS
jgi:flagellar hook-associated protein 1